MFDHSHKEAHKEQEASASNVLRLGLLRYSQQEARTERIIPASEVDKLLSITHELESCYWTLKRCEAMSVEEEFYLDQVRLLEDARFDLLARINGSNVDAYNTLPLHVAK